MILQFFCCFPCSGAMPGLSQPPPPTDAPVVDTAEQVYISSLALLKMLKHGRAGVPMEVMGLMLGEYSEQPSRSKSEH
jgi:26S proteasome regulatory subunit N11